MWVAMHFSFRRCVEIEIERGGSDIYPNALFLKTVAKSQFKYLKSAWRGRVIVFSVVKP